MKLNEKTVGLLISSLVPYQDQNLLFKVLYTLWERHKDDEDPKDGVNPCTLDEYVCPILELIARPVCLVKINLAIEEKIKEQEAEQKKKLGPCTTYSQEVQDMVHQWILERDIRLLEELREILKSLENHPAFQAI